MDAKAKEFETLDVAPVNRGDQRSLYAKRKKIHPKRARGAFRGLKWGIMALTLPIYYLAPWLRWDRGPNAPDQAFLLDLPGRRFYFLFIEIWPQEVYYITGLLILAAVGLFLATSLFGRAWCGYACPQTVWTDLFIAVERLVEGDRSARIRLDRQPWRGTKLAKKLVKHLLWLAVAVLTGGAWVFYFADAPTLLGQLVVGEAPAVSYLFIALMTFTTYMLGAIAREQVCIYMCPWPRIQAAMQDEETFTVTYRSDRGEPRGPYRKGDGFEGRGHCVDCRQCVAVCPMGIDIRDGPQLECISCALCIDACNEVMGRIDLPKGLIAYDNGANIQRRDTGEAARFRPVRARTIFYAVVLVVVGAIMLTTLATRATVELNVQADRNPLFTRLSDGSIRNAYTVKILNKRPAAAFFDLAIEGMEGAVVDLVGADASDIAVPADRLGSFRLLLTVPAAAIRDARTPLVIRVTDRESGEAATSDSQFRGPRR